jgi:1,2-diacylglycerol 3-alpha-glucosyltransferase
MKIAIFTETYLPTVNGVVNSIELFRHELESRGHKIYIITPHSTSENFKSRAHVFRIPSLPLIGQPSHPVPYFSLGHVKSIIEEIKPDIVHVQGMFFTGLLGKMVAIKNNIPCILTYHTHLEGYAHYAGILAPIVKPLLRFWTKYYCKKFNLIITPSPSMAKMLKSYGIRNDIVALPTGIVSRDYSSLNKIGVRSQLALESDKIYLFFVGRLAEEKNVKQLLKDFGRLYVRLPKVHLLLAGDGPDRKIYEAIIETRGLQSSVTFLGSLPHEKLVPYYTASDIFVFPSQTDTQGIVLIEAMASGLPSVVYNMLGPGDIVKHNECGFKANVNSDQFFQFMFELANDASLRDKIGVGAQREARKYSIEKTSDQMEQLYQLMIGK